MAYLMEGNHKPEKSEDFFIYVYFEISYKVYKKRLHTAQE